jgi:hypothetical protein
VIDGTHRVRGQRGSLAALDQIASVAYNRKSNTTKPVTQFLGQSVVESPQVQWYQRRDATFLV